LKWLTDDARFKIANKARQTRFSTTIALEAVIGARSGTNSLLVSAAEKNAQEVLDKCSRWVSAMKQAGVRIEVATESRSEISFAGGGKILSLAQNPNTVRGFSGNVYLDEFAHHTNDKEIYEAILPTITAGFRLAIISTPLGQSGLFYGIWANEGKYQDFTRHRTDIYSAREQGLPVDIELIRRNFDDDSFRQEYLCEFIDESTAYYPYSLIRSNVGDGDTDGGDLYVGIDVGRKHDLTVIYVLRKLGDKLYTVSIDEMKNETFENQKAAIRNILTVNNPKRCKVDATGLGSQLAEELAAEFYQVDPVTFTAEVKERMAVNVKKAFEQRTLQIPDNQKLVSDIHSIRKTVTASNNVRFDAERTEQGHADRFWAMALALDGSLSGQSFSLAFTV